MALIWGLDIRPAQPSHLCETCSSAAIVTMFFHMRNEPFNDKFNYCWDHAMNRLLVRGEWIIAGKAPSTWP